MGEHLNTEVVLTGESFGVAQELTCPSCGGNNLHQNGVEAYFRDEDADIGVVVSASRVHHASTHTGSQKRNPSGRRDGIRIFFTCEVCHGDPDVAPYRPPFELTIVQHKGMTFMEWEDK